MLGMSSSSDSMEARTSQNEQSGICVLGMSSSSDPMKASRSGAQMRSLWSPDGDGLAPAGIVPEVASSR